MSWRRGGFPGDSPLGRNSWRDRDNRPRRPVTPWSLGEQVTGSPSSNTTHPDPPPTPYKVKYLDVNNKTDKEPPDTPENGVYKSKTEPTKEISAQETMTIASNYIKVSAIPDSLYLYSLRYSRSKANGEREYFDKRLEIEQAFNEGKRHASDPLRLNARKILYATNFKELWSKSPIGDAQNQSWVSFDFEYPQLNGTVAKEVRVEFNFDKQITGIKGHLQGDKLGQIQDYIRALNACVGETIRQRYHDQDEIIQPNASKSFKKYGYQSLLQKDNLDTVRAVRGYFTSVRPGSNSMLLNINTATSAFLPPSSLASFIQFSMKPANNGYPERFDARQAFGSNAEKLLKGAFLRICYDRGPYDKNTVDYDTEHKRTVRFEQFGKLATEQKFWHLLPLNQRGKARQIDYSKPETTVQQYFSSKSVFLNSQNHYDMICVNVGKPVRTKLRHGEALDSLMKEQSIDGAQWIPAMLLQIKENQMVKSPLPSVYVSDMIRKALRLPAANAHLIQNEGLEILGVKNQPLKAMGFQVGDKLINLPARTLQPPVLDYDGKSQTPRLAQWNFKDFKFRFPASIERLHVVALETGPRNPSPRKPRNKDPGEKIPSNEDTSDQAKNIIFNTLKGHGVRVNRVQLKFLDNYESALRLFFKNHVESAKDCTVILLPNEENERTYSYSTIKRISDFLGTHVLCVKQNKLVSWNYGNGTWRESLQMASNLALKINMKFSGENHRLGPKLLDSVIPSEHRNHTIVMGADVAHPSPMARDGCPSVASIVGSVDGNFMRYQGSMRLQGGHQEKIEGMCSMVKERLVAWKESNKNSNRGGKGALPTNILFYRDGVSESQFNICEEYEMNEIRKAYKELAENGDDIKLRLTFVVVVKRHHTRFYATDDKDTYANNPKKSGFNSRPTYNGNLIPGLLVTDVVTNPKPNDFFLQSHKALQGTARSAHYHILEDGMKLGMNRIPELTHLLCYAFGRATTGVSYAAPAYIADRLCDRGMQYLVPWKDVTSDLEPRFKLSRDARTMTKEEITVEKQAFAVRLNELLANDATGEWPKTIEVREDETVLEFSEPTRLNPWHSNLDKGMFWM